MARFKIEVLNGKGKVVEIRDITLPKIKTVRQVTHCAYVNRIRRGILEQSFGLQIKIIPDKVVKSTKRI